MFIASATVSGDQLSYYEVNNSDAKPKRLAATPLPVVVLSTQFGSGGR
jgi:hypothetical protein